MPLQAPQTGAPFLRRARRSNKAMTLENDPFELLAFTFHLAFTFYIVILALRILEHWFLVSPIPAEANWSVKARKALSGPEHDELQPNARETFR